MTLTLRRRLWPKSLAGKAATVFISAVLLLTVLWAIALFMAERRLSSAWAAGEAYGLPTRLEELLPPALPKEQNAALPLVRASERSTELLLAWEDRVGVPVHQLYQRPYLSLVVDLLVDPVFEAQLNAADTRAGYAPLDDPTATDIDVRRQLVAVKDLVHAENLLAWHLAHEGRYEEAMRRLVRALRLARKWGEKETTFVGFGRTYQVRWEYVHALNEFIRRSDRLSWRIADEIDDELRRHETSLALLPVLSQRQKHIALKSYDDFFPWTRLLVVRPFTRSEQASIVETLNVGLRCTATPYAAVKNEMESMKQREGQLRTGRLPGLQRELINALSNIHWTRYMMDRLTAEVRCLRIVAAMAKWNAYDSELDALGLPQDCLVDPFDGNRLRVKRTPKGRIVYSVGANLFDDGGDFHEAKDVGLQPAQRRISD